MAAGNGQKGGERASSIEQMRREHLINRRNVEQAACGKENAVSNALDQSHNEQSITFYADLGPELCKRCHKPLRRSKHVVNIEGLRHKWHSECFQCNVCKQPLDKEKSCHVYKDEIVCRDDYAKLRDKYLKNVKCARCRWTIGASDWVRRAADRVYHLACFSCDLCSRQLSTGEQFALSNVLDNSTANKSFDDENQIRILCRLHFDIEQQPHPEAHAKAPQSTLAPSPSPVDYVEPDARTYEQYESNKQHYIHMAIEPARLEGQQNQDSVFNADATLRQSTNARDRAQSETVAASDSPSMHQSISVQAHQSQLASSCVSHNTASSGSSHGSSGGSKSKRVRTTFTEDQLSILQTHFHIDSNPDGQDLERIATITGLSKRVTQVWFQNSRARQKKHLIKRKPQQQQQHQSHSSQMPPAQSFGLGLTQAAATHITGLPGVSSAPHYQIAAQIGSRKWPLLHNLQPTPRSSHAELSASASEDANDADDASLNGDDGDYDRESDERTMGDAFSPDEDEDDDDRDDFDCSRQVRDISEHCARAQD